MTRHRDCLKTGWIGLAPALLLAAASARADVVVAERGERPLFSIQLPEAPAASQLHAANELQSHVRRMTGVQLPIRVGKSELQDRTEGARRILLGFTSSPELGSDGFRLRFRGRDLAIEGSRERGTLFGVYALLNRWGVDWFSSWCETVPVCARLSLPPDLDVTEKPAFDVRLIWWADLSDHAAFAGRLRVHNASGKRPLLGADPWPFASGLGTCHTFDALVPPARHFAEHPEYFSEIQGVRTAKRGQLCLTNPDVLALATARVCASLRATPSARYAGVSANDWQSYCTCAKCRAVDAREGSPSGTLIQFVNGVADVVATGFPGRLVQTLAYQHTRHAPKTLRPRPNVMVTLCSIECDFTRPFAASTLAVNRDFLRDLRDWSARAAHLSIWDYAVNCAHHLLPFPNVPVMADNLRLFQASGACALIELGGGYHAEFSELKAYVLAHLAWNPNTPTDELVDRFLAGYYGAAAPFVRRYYDALARAGLTAHAEPVTIYSGPTTLKALLPDGFLRQAAAWWREAEAAVREDPVRLYNVRTSSLAVDYALMTCLYRPVNLGGGLNPAETRSAASRLVRNRRLAAAAGHPVTLSDSRVIRTRNEALIAEAAAGRRDPVGDGSTAVIEEGFLDLSGPDLGSELVVDSGARNGRALGLTNTHSQWGARFPMEDVATRPGDRVRLCVRLRTETTGLLGEVVRIGVWDAKNDRVVGSRTIRSDEIRPGYAEYEILTWTPDRHQIIFIAPGRFDARRFGRSPVHNGVLVDCLTLTRSVCD